MTPAQHFAIELNRAILTRGVTNVVVANAVGVRDEWISTLRNGKGTPSYPVAVRLAEALEWPSLAETAREVRTGKCLVCERPFISNQRGGYANRKFCSRPCMLIEQSRTRRGTNKETSRFHYRRLRVYQETVAAFCMECEPEGLCRNAECPLRPVSPIPSSITSASCITFGQPKRTAPTRDSMKHRTYNREWMREDRAGSRGLAASALSGVGEDSAA